MANIEYTDTTGKIDHAFTVGIPQFGVAGVIRKLFVRAGSTGGHIPFFQLLQFFVSHASPQICSGFDVPSVWSKERLPCHPSARKTPHSLTSLTKLILVYQNNSVD